MNVIEISERCIKKYLEKYNIKLSIKETFDGKIINEGKIKISSENNPKFGVIKYSFDEDELFIDKIRVSENKHGVSVKPFKIFLLYLLARYSNRIKYVRLTASPLDDKYFKKGKEQGYCLSCYYQKLGFEPVESDIVELENMIKFCIRKLGANYKNKHLLCVLCDCQKQIGKEDIELEGYKISALQVRMEALLPNIKKELEDSYKTIINEC